MRGDLAPVALFAFRRPDHLTRTLASLAENPLASRTDVVVFSDGPRDDADRAAVDATRSVVDAATGFASVRRVDREANAGLSRNVIAGVTQMLGEHERLIVLEDDMVVSPDFLAYQNAGLDLYADDPSVASIHAYIYATRTALPDLFFLRGADCWGWATWRRAWAMFDPDGAALLARIENEGLTEAFDLDGSYPYTQMLRDQIAGVNDSWAVRWYASAFLAGALTLYPGRSLVTNIGLDGSGTHAGDLPALTTGVARMPQMRRIPIEESLEARAAIADALRPRRGRAGRFLDRLGVGGRR